MATISEDRWERVRKSLLHIYRRELTEEPGPDQPENFARRRIRFEQHRDELADYRAKQNAARAAAAKRADDELRAGLDRIACMFVPAH